MAPRVRDYMSFPALVDRPTGLRPSTTTTLPMLDLIIKFLT